MPVGAYFLVHPRALRDPGYATEGHYKIPKSKYVSYVTSLTYVLNDITVCETVRYEVLILDFVSTGPGLFSK